MLEFIGYAYYIFLAAFKRYTLFFFEVFNYLYDYTLFYFVSIANFIAMLHLIIHVIGEGGLGVA